MVVIGVIIVVGVIVAGFLLYRIWQLYTSLALRTDLEVKVTETLHLPAIPIKGAIVTVVGVGTLKSGITDENGTVILADMPIGEYAALVEKEGFLSFALPLGDEAPAITMMGGTLGWTIFQVGAKSYQWTPPAGPYAYAAADPAAVLVKRGTSTNVTFTLTPHNFFEGRVQLELPRFEPYPHEPLPSELILELSTSSVILNATAEASVILTITVGSEVPVDTYILSIPLKGEYGTLYRPLLLGVV